MSVNEAICAARAVSPLAGRVSGAQDPPAQTFMLPGAAPAQTFMLPGAAPAQTVQVTLELAQPVTLASFQSLPRR